MVISLTSERNVNETEEKYSVRNIVWFKSKFSELIKQEIYCRLKCKE